ncbi:uncharacterized protein KRP23_2026 [Phytophthora ramorum]|uniref:uncharacterized protein n=1 Tax=Phytophthora ramorum TaxID=164328 RepID=UPI0030B2F9B0|nr:hypothetical protein KRP23_2026 [Phytophthora ramorum]
MPSQQAGEVLDAVNEMDTPREVPHLADLVLGTDDVTMIENSHPDQRHRCVRGHDRMQDDREVDVVEPSTRSTPRRSVEPRPSVTELVVAEVATFYDVFGFLGVPMIIVFVLSALWTFILAYIQVHATKMANSVMNTTNFDNGEFWLLPHPEDTLVVPSVVMLSLFGIGYTGLAIMVVLFHRLGKEVKSATDAANASNSEAEPKAVKDGKFDSLISWVSHKFNVPKDIRDHYYAAALDLPKLIFQTTTLTTYLSHGFPTPIIYSYSALLLCNWLAACYRSQRYVVDPDLIIARLYYTYDLFFAVFAPLVVLLYFIETFEFDRAEFATKIETIQGGSYDTIARLFGDPSQISSFCNAFHYLQFSTGDSLFFKSALNLLSLYKWRKIIMTLIHNHHERRLERERKAQVQPLSDENKPRGRAQSFKAAIAMKIEASTQKPKLGKHFIPKILLSLIFFVAGSAIFVYSIGSVRSSHAVCKKFDKCVVASYRWNFGVEHCPCLVFADRQTAPRTYAEWTDPEDTTSKLAELAFAGELRIVQIINRAVPELPDELRNCHHLEQIILVYTKTLRLPEWMSEFNELEYFHMEGDYTSKRLQTVPAGIFDHMPHLTFIHFGGIPDVEELPSFSSLVNLRYLTLAILNSLKELPSFDGLSKLTALNIVEATSAKTLPSLTPLKGLISLGLRYRTGVCCNGFITGTCDTTSFQCVPKAGEKNPMTCVSERASEEDKAILDMYDTSEICPNSFAYDLESAAPTKYTSDELCGSTLYKECYLNGVQGICYNTRMMVISCVTQAAYITMRQLQIERKVGDRCIAAVESWLGCT